MRILVVCFALAGCSGTIQITPPPEVIETAKVAECVVADTIGELVRCR